MLRQAGSHAARLLGLRAGQQAQQQQAMLGAMLPRAYSAVVDGLLYAKSHEWAKVEGDVATVGISDHAQSELGDVVYVELPEVGKALTKGEAFGVVESVKAASDVYAPLSGEVLETNQLLADKPATINAEPYKAGWIMKVKLSNKGELGSLLDAKAYEKECAH